MPKFMPNRHQKFIIAIGIIATLWLPYFSEAFFEEALSSVGSSVLAAGQNTSSTLTSFGSTLDQSVDAVTDISRSTYHVSRSMYHAAGRVITKQYSLTKSRLSSLARSTTKEITTNAQLSLLRSASFGRQAISPIQSILNTTITQTEESLRAIKNTAQQALSSFSSHLPYPASYLSSVKQGALSLLAIPNTQDTITKQIPNTKNQIPKPQIKDQKSIDNPLRIIERILVKEHRMPQAAGSLGEQKNNPPNTSSIIPAPRIDQRVDALITSLADLTARVDERYGVSDTGGSYSNNALFNMISQSQRIKTLDDVKITNATIEGYASSKSVSDSYLPLGGGHTHRRTHWNHPLPLWSLQSCGSQPLRNA